jgi:phytoene desaturase
MKTRSVIVIGAGIGGITAAIHLAKHGLHVTVLEKNSHPGGRCDRFSRAGHHFDTGPTLFVMPLLYEAEFRALGASLHEQLDLQRVDPTYQLVFDDGSRLALTSDMQSMREQMERMEAGSFHGLLRYLHEGDRHYRLTLAKLVNCDFRRASDFFNLDTLALLFHLKPLVNHYHNISAYFDDPRLKSAFTFQDIYTGLSPIEAPATYSMMPYTELAHGVWYPKGGMYRIVESLIELARAAGVEFVFDAAVERIDTNQACAQGVLLAGGTHLHADIVLANADLPYVYQNLLPQDGSVAKLSQKRFSCSAISFFWGWTGHIHNSRLIRFSWRTIIARTSSASIGTWGCLPTPIFISTPRRGSTHSWLRVEVIRSPRSFRLGISVKRASRIGACFVIRRVDRCFAACGLLDSQTSSCTSNLKKHLRPFPGANDTTWRKAPRTGCLTS